MDYTGGIPPIEQVRSELTLLCHGAALANLANVARLDPTVWAGIVPEQYRASPLRNPLVVRGVIEQVVSTISAENREQGRYAEVALGLDPAVAGSFTDRQARLSEEFSRSQRTVRRKCGEAVAVVAVLLVNADPSHLAWERRDAEPGLGSLAVPGVSRFWTFDESSILRILISKITESHRPRYASISNPNYIRAASYGDTDALFDLHGHLRATNPSAEVKVEFVDDLLQSDDLAANLFVLGGLTFDQMPSGLRRLIRLPITRVPGVMSRGEVFRFDDHLFGPEFDGEELTQDVGVLARLRNPIKSDRFITVFGGVYTRGVHGAVRSVTHKLYWEANCSYLVSRFGEHQDFVVLMRVPVAGASIGTPDLTVPENRLFEHS